MRFNKPANPTEVTTFQRFAMIALDAGESLLDAARARVLGVTDAPDDPGPTIPRDCDLGVALRVEALEARISQVEGRTANLPALDVVERRRAPAPCCVCGGRVVLVLEGAPRREVDAGWFNGLCAGCLVSFCAPPDSEVIP